VFDPYVFPGYLKEEWQWVTGRMLVSDTAVMLKARVRETLPAANFVAPPCHTSWRYACGSPPDMKKSLFRLYALSGYLKKGGQPMPTFLLRIF